MRPGDILWYAFKGLKDRKTRSALTILGIMIGILAIITLISNTSGFDNFLNEVLSRIGSNNIWIIPVEGSVKFTDTDVIMLSRLPGVRATAPFYFTRVMLKSGSIERQVNFLATDPRMIKLILPDLELLEGEPLQPADVAVVALGYKVAYPPEDPSKSIRLYSSVSILFQGSQSVKTKTFMVGAIYNEFGSTPYLDVDNSILATVEAARNMFGSRYYPAIVIVASSPDAVEPLIKMLRDIYGRDIEIISPLTIVRNVRAIISNFSIFMLIVASVSLIVAGIGIMNTMIMSVMERTREIGVLRALGFTQKHVAAIFLAEAALIGAIGGILGIVLGISASLLLGDVFARMFQVREASTPIGQALQISYTPVITPELIIESFFFAILVGVFSGLYPAVKAARMDPVQALRSE
ncbi:MAG: FtsX-like permease family protein [Aigarchaeota archaeon]|nr:FtsX-like permease family protein [Candidatus Wolframiiraptor gerlachensis]